MLKRRFPQIRGPQREDICYATSNRQWAVKELLDEVDLLLVIGSRNSSNSNRLVEVAHAAGVASHLIDDESEIDERWLTDVDTVGITSGASAPERLVERVCDWFRAYGVADISSFSAVTRTSSSGCRSSCAEQRACGLVLSVVRCAGRRNDQRLPEQYFTALLARVAAAATEGGEPLVDLGRGNPEVGPPDHVVAALAESAGGTDVHGYAPFAGLPALKEAIAARYADVYRVELDPDA